MHRREHIHAARGEDARDLSDHARGIRNEDERMLMKDDVELSVAERAQVAHVGAQVIQLCAAAPRETPHRRELSGRDIDEGGRRAQLRE
jgi:hypothetical protein